MRQRSHSSHFDLNQKCQITYNKKVYYLFNNYKKGINMKTLSEFIVERQAEYPNAKGELSGILSSIRLLAKIIHRDINKAG